VGIESVLSIMELTKFALTFRVRLHRRLV